MFRLLLTAVSLWICLIGTALANTAMQADPKLKPGQDINLNIHVEMNKHMSVLPSKESIDHVLKDLEQVQLDSNIFLIFIDTLRQDYIETYAPNITAFSNQFISGQYLSNASATQHSTYAIYHSQPSFLAFRDLMNTKAENQKGALIFRMFHALGYDIVAIGTEIMCLDKEVERGSWDATIESHFGYKTSLLKNCEDKNAVLYPKTVEVLDLSDNYTDDDVSRTFKEIYLTRKAEGNPKTLYFIYLYNAHNPYQWDKTHRLPYPDMQKLRGMDIPEIFDYGSKEDIRKAYANAIGSTDIQFANIINTLKQNNDFHNSTIIFLSDHGESLGEKSASTNSKHKPRMEKDKLMYLHGNSLYKEQLSVPFVVKFPQERHQELVQAGYTKFLQGMDIMPSILDGIGIKMNYYNDVVRGCSIFSTCAKPQSRSFVAALPNGTEPTNKLALVNIDYKVQIQINDPDFYAANTFTIINITDHEDNPIYDQAPFKAFGIDPQRGTVKEKAALIRKIKRDFAEALEDLFSE